MPLIVFENNANATLLNDIGAADTTITFSAGQGANFPSITPPNEIFFITLQNYAAQLVEICRVTDRSGDVLTVERGQDGTIALAWPAATTAIQLRLTKETLGEFVQKEGNLIEGSLLTVNAQGQLVNFSGEIAFTLDYEYFTATEGQSVFNTAATLPTTEGNIFTFINGVRQFAPTNYSRTGSNEITFTEGLALGDDVAIGS